MQGQFSHQFAPLLCPPGLIWDQLTHPTFLGFKLSLRCRSTKLLALGPLQTLDSSNEFKEKSFRKPSTGVTSSTTNTIVWANSRCFLHSRNTSQWRIYSDPSHSSAKIVNTLKTSGREQMGWKMHPPDHISCLSAPRNSPSIPSSRKNREKKWVFKSLVLFKHMVFIRH